MNIRISPAPVRKTLTVKASPEKAFEVFTAGMTRWWRPDHHIGKSPLKEVVAEPRVGGRWYEVCADGSECDWGKVLVWDPPGRVVLAWQLTSEWRYDPNFVTEVEIRFSAEGTGTRVDLEHRSLERFGDRATEVRAALDSPDGWSGSLASYAALFDRQGADG